MMEFVKLVFRRLTNNGYLGLDNHKNLEFDIQPEHKNTSILNLTDEQIKKGLDNKDIKSAIRNHLNQDEFRDGRFYFKVGLITSDLEIAINQTLSIHDPKEVSVNQFIKELFRAIQNCRRKVSRAAKAIVEY